MWLVTGIQAFDGPAHRERRRRWRYELEVVADSGPDRAVHHAVAEAAVTPASNIEFGAKCTLEHRMSRRRFDLVQ